jgi:hypothetical protein
VATAITTSFLQVTGSCFRYITSSLFDKATYNNSWVRIGRYSATETTAQLVGGYGGQLKFRLTANPVAGNNIYSDSFIGPVTISGSNSGNWSVFSIYHAGFGKSPTIDVESAYVYTNPLFTKIRTAKDAGNLTWYVDAFVGSNQITGAIDLARVELLDGPGVVQWGLNPNSASYTGSVEFDIIYPGIRSAEIYAFNIGGAITASGNAIIGGNVGIGTTSPSSLLHVYKASGDSILTLDNTGNGNTSGINFNRERLSGPGINGASIFLDSNTADNNALFYIQAQTTSAGAGVSASLDANNGVRILLRGGTGVLSMENGASESMRIDANGNVGIGTTNPSYKLHVSGSFAATTKSFVIEHPTKPNKKLVYGALESPYHGIRLTGKGHIKNGCAEVLLPDYIHKLVRPESVNIQLTPIKCGKTIYVQDIYVEENRFTVECDDTLKEFDFFWDFTGTRTDVDELITEI